jgi:hypothetical protein
VRFAPACWAAWRGLDTFRPYIGRFVTNPLASLRLRGSPYLSDNAAGAGGGVAQAVAFAGVRVLLW